MVKKQLESILSGGPPPLDESWWEAVLTEEAMRGTHNHSTSHSRGAQRQVTARTPDKLDINWDLAISLFEKDKAARMLVEGYNRGGLLVSGDGLEGFLPISHLIDHQPCHSEEEQESFLKAYTGQWLELKIIECDPERGRVVFSERAALAGPGSRNQLLLNLKPGECIEGTVTNITDFGVFVDLGGLEGLVHVSELSWGRVRHPSDVVNYGDHIKVHVIMVDPNTSRIALSIKRLHPNPWASAEERYCTGQIANAQITSIVPFGAFARLEEGLDGLIHVSEMPLADGDHTRPQDILQEGQPVQVRIIHVDAERQRLGLSLYLEE